MNSVIVLASFIGFLLLITAIGVFASMVQHQKSTEDYLVAGRSVPAWLSALSAVATNNSGFMFIGLIGYTYRYGYEAIWMMIGWIVGDFLAWQFVHPRLRLESGKIEATTVPMLIGSRRNKPGTNRILVIVTGLLTFIFLGAYAAAQLKAGSTALQTLFGWNPEAGAIIGTFIVIIYCYAGGIRASIWTDAAQSGVMIVSMILLLGTAVYQIGGPAGLSAALASQDPSLVNWLPADLKFGFLPYFLGMTAGGFGAVGQPHILVRFMAIESVEKISRAKMIYFAWFIPFFLLGIGVGLYSRALLPDLMHLPLTEGMSASQASEFAMPVLARELLPDVLLGLMLAGLFSATMSTADSQILVCSGSLTQDVFPQWKNSYAASKVATLLVAALALAIALSASDSVFALVLVAWSAMGATLGPILILRLYGRRPNTVVSLAMMAAGLTTVFVWNSVGLDGAVFKLLPGFLAPVIVYIITIIIGTVFSPKDGDDDENEAIPPASNSQQES
ncbi:sodium/proline symporter [bacterium]|nr:sodium:proline symporter [Planctomyces sp.]MBR9804340.1 sodium/proline symporter [bacterium]